MRRPPVLFSPSRRDDGEPVPIFEPYEENLPLEAGIYSFVIDANGFFHIKRGNTTSHSSMVGNADVGAAGRFRINRVGCVAEVACFSTTYRLIFRRPGARAMTFVIESFTNHHALELSPWAIFEFPIGPLETLRLDHRQNRIEDLELHQRMLDQEGQGKESLPGFDALTIQRFEQYQPTPPARLYPMHRDQLIIAVEDEDTDDFQFGPSMPRYTPGSLRLNSGRKAFILDEEGWLVAGPHGHHILSGGGAVGGAGQIVLDITGEVGEVNLNFSGHYRPTLDAAYAQYVYAILRGHPLLSFKKDCKIMGRKFTSSEGLSTALRFQESELLGDPHDLDLMIEMASF